MPDNRLGVLGWNPHKGNPWATVRATLNLEAKRDRPDLIVLNEVKRHHGVLDGWAERNGYVCFQETPIPEKPGMPVSEEGSTAVLIDAGLGVLSVKLVSGTVLWKVFSHNRWHEPRRGWQIRFRDDSGKWKGRFVHGPTNGFEGGNRAAFAEFAGLMRDALTSRAAGVVTFAVGDHNERLGVLRKWGRLFGAKVAGHSVDSCVVVGGTVTAEALGKYGSDHELIRYSIIRNP